MVNFKRILFPVDFTPQCKIAARHVAAYARHFDAEICLLHVETLRLEPSAWESSTNRLEQLLEQFLVSELAGLKVQRLLAIGDPAQEIVRHANNEKADLVMMPTHGHGPFRRFLLGSVTAKVLHDTPCPVWTSAHLVVERVLPLPNFTDVICAVDLDETGVHTLRYAGNFARHVGARLTIAHAVPAVETPPEAYMDAELRADLMETARRRLAEMKELAECEGVICVGSGDIARFVGHAAQSHHAGLVIIGRGGNGVLGRLRTHDYAIIRHSECPVLSI